jgi:hypothetical protein
MEFITGLLGQHGLYLLIGVGVIIIALLVMWKVAKTMTKIMVKVAFGLVLAAGAAAGMYFYVCPAFGLPLIYAGYAALGAGLVGLIFGKIPFIG